MLQPQAETEWWLSVPQIDAQDMHVDFMAVHWYAACPCSITHYPYLACADRCCWPSSD